MMYEWITLDIDRRYNKTNLKRWLILINHTLTYKYEYAECRPSAHGHIHIRIKLHHAIDFNDLTYYRLKLHDDTYRIIRDIEREREGTPIQKLFDTKIIDHNGHSKELNAGKWTDMRIATNYKNWHKTSKELGY
jgi:hypothetical protein